jgi:putative isomerase
MRNFFWVKDVPFNAILVENLRCMSSIAKTLGYNEDIIYFNEQADLITEAMRKFMYEDGIFWSTYDLDYKKIKTLTWSIFSPLFAGILTDEEAKNIVDKYLKNENKFNTKFSVPTVAVDEVSYNPDGFWRGPVWMATNWFIFKGLMRYGFVEEAKKILDSSLDLIEQSGFREQYNPNTGEGLGAKDFTWGGLILDMDISLYKGKS